MRELESLVEKMVGSYTQDLNDNSEEFLLKTKESGTINGIKNSDSGIRVSLSNDFKSQSSDSRGNSDSELDKEDELIADVTPCIEHLDLFEEPCSIVENSEIDCKHEPIFCSTEYNDINPKQEFDTLSHDPLDEKCCETEDSELKLNTKCCDFMNNCQDQNNHPMLDEVNEMGPCSKVYTHKKRKNDQNKISSFCPHFGESSLQLLTSNCIDLVEASNRVSPVTIQINLDNESTDYIFSFSSESVQSVMGGAFDDNIFLNNFDLFEIRTNLNGRVEHKIEAEDEVDKPTLRRSSRLNQQENEEATTVSKNHISKHKLAGDKKKKNSVNVFPRNKRKSKDSEHGVPNGLYAAKKVSAKPIKKSTKLNGKCISKSPLPKVVRDFSKSKSTAMERFDYLGNRTNESNSSPTPSFSNTSVSRALWGDMSDLIEDGRVVEEFLEYDKSTEIPFAVGLLPLRAALERMQATLDHQPRKTRSSIQTNKNAVSDNGNLKRRGTPNPTDICAKKQSSAENELENEHSKLRVENKIGKEMSPFVKIEQLSIETKSFEKSPAESVDCTEASIGIEQNNTLQNTSNIV